MRYKWSEEFETGHNQIDTEHKKLLDAINELVESCKKGAEREQLAKTVDFLLSYTETHFSHEESLQLKYNYPDYERHKQRHKYFIDTVLNIKKRLSTEGPSMSLIGEINSKVAIWIINHIQKEDVKVASHINNHSK